MVILVDFVGVKVIDGVVGDRTYDSTDQVEEIGLVKRQRIVEELSHNQRGRCHESLVVQRL